MILEPESSVVREFESPDGTAYAEWDRAAARYQILTVAGGTDIRAGAIAVEV